MSAPGLGNRAARGSQVPGDQRAGAPAGPSLASAGASRAVGPGGRGLGHGEEGAAWRARALAACTRRGGEGWGRGGGSPFPRR